MSAVVLAASILSHFSNSHSYRKYVARPRITIYTNIVDISLQQRRRQEDLLIRERRFINLLRAKLMIGALFSV